MLKNILKFFKRKDMSEKIVERVMIVQNPAYKSTNLKIPFKSGWYRTQAGFTFLIVKDSKVCYDEEGKEFALDFMFNNWVVKITDTRTINIFEKDFVK